ncbi:MAG TPA: hypothetical protein VFF30_02175 [Nitrososphaerales archaeon]|nr:hypothetical protein [Nitrososphaerales archaeon]
MIDYPFIILFGLHIIGVVSWFGATILFVSVIEPSLKRMDPDSMKDFMIKVIPRLARFSIAMSALTLLAGFFLFDYVSTTEPYLLPSPRILFIYAGGILGFVAFLVVVTGMLGTSSKLRSASIPSLPGGSGGVATGESTSAMLGHVAETVRGTLLASSYLLFAIFVLMVLGANL